MFPCQYVEPSHFKDLLLVISLTTNYSAHMSIIPSSAPNTYQSLKDIFLHCLKDIFIHFSGVEKGKETWTICLLQAEVKFSIVVLLVFDLLLPMCLICCCLRVWYCCCLRVFIWIIWFFLRYKAGSLVHILLLVCSYDFLLYKAAMFEKMRV
jgi:hypothetical protein